MTILWTKKMRRDKVWSRVLRLSPARKDQETLLKSLVKDTLDMNEKRGFQI